ncbi:hypothetical protein, partial [Chryseobacterium indologenes]|uniref:hypothetical protein n=1 Tax=Chryseobacterium indologenes TaxID=253 RepID=UPI001E59FDAA
LGLVNYFLLRHRNMNFGENYFRKFVHSECLNLIFNHFINYIEACIYRSSITNNEFDYCCKILLKCGYCIEYIFYKDLFDKLIEFHIYCIQYLEKKIRQEDQTGSYLEGFLYLLLSVKQRKYTILEKKLNHLSKSLNTSLLNHFIYKIYSKNDLKYSSLQNDELIFLLTNCINS